MAKAKKQTSFGQFDMGRGTAAARKETQAPRDATTITGQRLSKLQRANITRQNQRKRS